MSPSDITYAPASSLKDFTGILDLQQKNLPEAISEEEAQKEGFLTCRHDEGLLARMNTPYPHIIALYEGQVVGYVLVMQKSFRASFPVIEPMFVQIEKVVFKGQPLDVYNYVILGQVCIDKSFRGMRIFDNLYKHYRESLASHFDYVITEVASRNLPSLKAHWRVGFETIHTYTDPRGEDWEIVIWALNEQ
ncbi:MAG: GNAT family N-acetyltransferase [Bacteroidota bacterium]